MPDNSTTRTESIDAPKPQHQVDQEYYGMQQIHQRNLDLLKAQQSQEKCDQERAKQKACDQDIELDRGWC